MFQFLKNSTISASFVKNCEIQMITEITDAQHLSLSMSVRNLRDF